MRSEDFNVIQLSDNHPGFKFYEAPLVGASDDDWNAWERRMADIGDICSHLSGGSDREVPITGNPSVVPDDPGLLVLMDENQDVDFTVGSYR